MQFEFRNPTRILFAAGALERLGEVTAAEGKTALLVTGGGSVKRNGTFDRAKSSLEAAGVKVVDFSGIEPNPRITSVRDGAKTARENGCDVIVALGGGSTMDASKAIAAAVLYDGDPWDMVHHGQEKVHVPAEALPVITAPTLAATGSEMNSGAVITDEETTVKSFLGAPCLYPRTAVVDPELTVSVPKDQTAYGVCDLITHVTESYFNGIDGTPVQDRFAEGVIRTALEWGPKAVENGEDIEARAQVQWSSVVALNGWVQIGTSGAYPVHMIEHVLSAHHDIAHGAGLAIVNPAWMRFAARTRPQRFAEFARNVMDVPAGEDDAATAAEGIDRFENFLRSIGCPTRLSEVGIDETLLERYAEDTVKVVHDEQGRLPGRPALTRGEIVGILRTAL